MPAYAPIRPPARLRDAAPREGKLKLESLLVGGLYPPRLLTQCDSEWTL